MPKKETSHRNSETLLKVTERIAHVGSVTWNMVTQEVYWSEEIYRIFGRQPGTSPPDSVEREKIYVDGSWPRLETAIRRAAELREPFDFEARIKRPDGTMRDIRIRGEVGPDENGDFVIVHATTQDITDWKKIQERLERQANELHELAARIEKVREEERKLISHEVHDELGQMLSAVKMNLLPLREMFIYDREEFARRIQAAIYLIDESMKAVRDISARLRPSVLDYLGLVPAMEWQVEQFQMHSGIKCELLVNPKEIKTDDDRSTALFRILQEALTNVGRHSHATQVWINLSESEVEYSLQVEDNGVGIREEHIESPHSIGLIGIKERLRLLGGAGFIGKRAEGGTMVLVKLPKKIGK